MTYRNSTRLATLAALAFTAACGSSKDTTAPTTQYARVRVVNLNAGAPTAGLYANGNLIGSNVNFGSAASSCISVPTGQTLSFRANGAPTNLTSNASAGLQANQNYTIVLYGTAANPQQMVLSDVGFTSPTTGNNMLRFFNGTTSAGDIYVTSQGGALGSSPSSSNLAAGSATTGSNAWMSFPNTSTQIRMFNTGTTTGTPNVNTSFTSSNLSSAGVGTAFLTNATMTGTGANASVVAAPCS